MTCAAESDDLRDPLHAAARDVQAKDPHELAPRVLVVEDDPPARRSISRGLRRLGYRVMGAQDGAEAIEIYAAHGADVVVTDIFMPRMNGVDLILELVLEHPELPVIAITGAPNQNPSVRSARLFGAREVLNKPFNAEKLAAAIAKVLPDGAV